MDRTATFTIPSINDCEISIELGVCLEFVQEFNDDEHDEEYVFKVIHNQRMRLILGTIYEDPDIFDGVLAGIMKKNSGPMIDYGSTGSPNSDASSRDPTSIIPPTWVTG